MHHQYSKMSSRIIQKFFPDHQDPAKLAKSIVTLSELYTKHRSDNSSIWDDPKLTEAYLYYFLPLNVLRLKSVFTECERLNFFTGLTRLIDIGSGPGTTDFALQEMHSNKISQWVFIDKNPKAFTQHKKLLQQCDITSQEREWHTQIPKHLHHADLLVFSYSQVEIVSLPTQAFDAEALIIIEPSVRDTARRLQQMRTELMQKGFSIWAPCTHHDECPLLKHSKTDWCHNRIHIEQPRYLQKIEQFLPFKNQSLTYSYLCARKLKPANHFEARIIGDTLHEKGKIKQAVCRNSSREFLTWLTRDGEPDPIERGSLINLPSQILTKGNELRISKVHI